jgi:hypothetical protein
VAISGNQSQSIATNRNQSQTIANNRTQRERGTSEITVRSVREQRRRHFLNERQSACNQHAISMPAWNCITSIAGLAPS